MKKVRYVNNTGLIVESAFMTDRDLSVYIAFLKLSGVKHITIIED